MYFNFKMQVKYALLLNCSKTTYNSSDLFFFLLKV